MLRHALESHQESLEVGITGKSLAGREIRAGHAVALAQLQQGCWLNRALQMEVQLRLGKGSEKSAGRGQGHRRSYRERGLTALLQAGKFRAMAAVKVINSQASNQPAAEAYPGKYLQPRHQQYTKEHAENRDNYPSRRAETARSFGFANTQDNH